MRLWNVNTGDIVDTLHGDNKSIYSVSFSSDGALLASAGSGSVVYVWDVSRGELLYTIDQGANSVAFNPTQHPVAVGSTDGIMRIYDSLSGRLVATLDEYNVIPIVSVAFGRDGTLLAAHRRDGSMWEWAVDSWQLLYSTGEDYEVLPNKSALAFSPDGSMIVSTMRSGLITFWSTSFLRGYQPRRFPNCFRGRGDGTVRIWGVSLGS